MDFYSKIIIFYIFLFLSGLCFLSYKIICSIIKAIRKRLKKNKNTIYFEIVAVEDVELSGCFTKTRLAIVKSLIFFINILLKTNISIFHNEN